MDSPSGSIYHRISPIHGTKIYVSIDSDVPILFEAPIAPQHLTLAQFKSITSLQDDSYKFYFKSHDPEFGIVKEEIIDDDSLLPSNGNRVVAWVISSDTVHASLFKQESPSVTSDRLQQRLDSPGLINSENLMNNDESFLRSSSARFTASVLSVDLSADEFNQLSLSVNWLRNDLESAGLVVNNLKQDSIAALNGRVKVGDKIVAINGVDLRGLKPIEVYLLFDNCTDGREAVRLVLERKVVLPHINYNDSFRQQSPYATNDELQKPKIPPRATHGFDLKRDLPTPILIQNSITESSAGMQVERRSNSSEASHFPRSLTPCSLYTSSNIENLASSTDLHYQLGCRSIQGPTTPTSTHKIGRALHRCHDIHEIYSALKADKATLDIRDREWLNVIIKDVFLGSALVKWLSKNIHGLSNRSEFKRYANKMLNLGFIKSPISNANFSEKCYYSLT